MTHRTVHYETFRPAIVWVSDFYDHPLAGICRWEGELCRFEWDYDDEWVRIYLLTRLQKVRWLWRKVKFEICVGYHWTYKDGKRETNFHYRNPQWLYRLLFRFHYRRWRMPK